MASHALLASQARTSSVLTFFFFGVGVFGSQILSDVFFELWNSHGLSGIFHCDWDQRVHSDFFFSDSRKYLNKNPFLRCIHIVFKYQKQQIRHISS
jgi:hypothetical protein